MKIPWFIDPKLNKPSVTLTFAALGWLITSAVLIVAVVKDSSNFAAVGGTLIGYQTMNFAAYLGRKWTDKVKDLKDIIKPMGAK